MKKILLALFLSAIVAAGLLVHSVHEYGLGFGFHVKAHMEDIYQKADFTADFDYGIKPKKPIVMIPPQRRKF